MMHDTLAWHYFISATASRIALLVYKCAQFPLDCMNTILSSHFSNEHATSCLPFHSKPYHIMKYQVCDDITVYLISNTFSLWSKGDLSNVETLFKLGIYLANYPW